MPLVDARLQIRKFDCFYIGDGHGERAIGHGCVDLGGQLLVGGRVAHQVVQDTIDRNGGRVGAGKSGASPRQNAALHVQKAFGNRHALTSSCGIQRKCVDM